jgi:hypothetical protein
VCEAPPCGHKVGAAPLPVDPVPLALRRAIASAAPPSPRTRGDHLSQQRFAELAETYQVSDNEQVPRA